MRTDTIKSVRLKKRMVKEMSRFVVYVDGLLVGFVRASSLEEAIKKAKEQFIDWPEQDLKVFEEED